MTELNRRLAVAGCLIALGVPFSANGVSAEHCVGLNAISGSMSGNPELAAACESVATVGGERYVSLRAEVLRLERDLLLIRFQGTRYDVALAPKLPRTDVAGRVAGTLPAELMQNDTVRVYVLERDLEKVVRPEDASEDAGVPVRVERLESPTERNARIANYTCCPRRRPWYPIPELLPATNTPLPLLAWSSLGLLVLAASIRIARLVLR